MMPADDATASTTDAEWRSPLDPATPLAIQVEDLHKSFSIPTNRVDSLKERIVHPLSGRDYRELRALDGVSFEIHQGEFFGIVGRNGSGKSTLLKLLASIYRADAGTVRMAGRLAPFIELGVGFNPELTARENVVLNGVMMGLTPQDTRDRLEAVVEFAELTEFIDLKLKNYSSGMLVRLAFAVMMEADADILLIDEVLAVGDAAFQQKCADAFREMKAAGKTIVLVTHEMRTVEEYCHRAMLVADGRIRYIGDPDEVGRRYLQLNFEHEGEGTSVPQQTGEELRMLEAWIEDTEGNHLSNLEHGRQLRLRVDLEILHDTPGLVIGFIIANADGVGIFQFGTHLVNTSGGSELAGGERVRVSADIENLLVQGRYFVHCAVNHAQDSSVALHAYECVDFVVFGGEPQAHGNVRLPLEIEAVVDSGAGR
jgi:ABC-type polysaccharide/polyol phosphate transport system ATPase subunit